MKDFFLSRQIVTFSPIPPSFAFAYGSGVLSQSGYTAAASSSSSVQINQEKSTKKSFTFDSP